MDEVDFRILGRLFQEPLAGPASLASTVGLTRNAVARRIANLQESGPRLKFFALPHNTLFGRSSTVCLYMPDEIPAPERLLAVRDVIGYDINHDGLCAVTLWQEDKVDTSLVDKMLGTSPIARYTDATPGPHSPYMSRLEWKVAAAMLANPRASAAELGRSTGLAARTCARARDRLEATAAIRMGINICEDLSGFPMFRLYVQGRPDLDKVKQALGRDMVVSDRVEEGTVYFARASTTGAIFVAVERVRNLPGVSDVKLILSRSNGLATARVLDWCRSASGANVPPR